VLGEEVELKGWSRFRGGLDAKGDTTGARSVFTTHQSHEVMFHVVRFAPFLYVKMSFC
jgi:hypothetical protein